MNVLEYHQPTSVSEAVRLKGECASARYIAGGTDLMVRLRAGAAAATLISLRGITELRGIEVNGAIRIGALATIAEILANEPLGRSCPVLHEAARPFASVQVRNLASLGGNLCNASPAADMAPALLALDARVALAGPDGEREMPLADFFVGPGETRLSTGEMLTAVRIDPPAADTRAASLRKGRVSMDLALASVAVRLEMGGDACRGVRIAAGAVAPRPIRLPAAEAVLEGHVPDADRIAEAKAAVEGEIRPIGDVRASAGYRRRLTGVLFARAMARALGNGGAS